MEETASPSKTTSKEKPTTAEEEKDGKSIVKTEPKNVVEEKDGNRTIKIEPETVSNEKEVNKAESSDNQKEEGEIDRPKVFLWNFWKKINYETRLWKVPSFWV